MKASLVGVVSLFLLAGCTADLEARTPLAVAKDSLPEPDWKVNGATPAPNRYGEEKIAAGPKSATVAPVLNLPQITVWCKEAGTSCPAAKTQKFTQISQGIVAHLLAEYGPPLYTGKVSLVVSTDPSINGRMAWRASNDASRQILINEFNFIESEWRVIAHEIFHALYQNNSFLKAYPDFIAEGLAVYVEYRYRYKDREPDAIATLMLDHLKGLGYPNNSKFLDFNIPFAIQGPKISDALYILSGYYFMSQSPEALRTALKKILSSKEVSSHERGWVSLTKFSEEYGLKVPESVSKEAASKEFSDSPGSKKSVASKPPANIHRADLCALSTANETLLSQFYRSVIDAQKYKKWRQQNC